MGDEKWWYPKNSVDVFRYWCTGDQAIWEHHYGNEDCAAHTPPGYSPHEFSQLGAAAQYRECEVLFETYVRYYRWGCN